VHTTPAKPTPRTTQTAPAAMTRQAPPTHNPHLQREDRARGGGQGVLRGELAHKGVPGGHGSGCGHGCGREGEGEGVGAWVRAGRQAWTCVACLPAAGCLACHGLSHTRGVGLAWHVPYLAHAHSRPSRLGPSHEHTHRGAPVLRGRPPNPPLAHPEL